MVRSEAQMSRNKHHSAVQGARSIASLTTVTADITAAQMCQHGMVLVQRTVPGLGAFREAGLVRLKYLRLSQPSARSAERAQDHAWLLPQANPRPPSWRGRHTESKAFAFYALMKKGALMKFPDRASGRCT